jgi:hypothetical protein
LGVGGNGKVGDLAAGREVSVLLLEYLTVLIQRLTRS